MPLENFEEEGLAKNPNLELAQWKFMMSTEQHKNDSDIKAKLLDAVKAGGTYFNITFFIRPRLPVTGKLATTAPVPAPPVIG